MRLTIGLLGCLKWSVDAAASTSSVSGTELTFGKTAAADTYSGRKLRRPGCVAMDGERVVGYVEYSISSKNIISKSLARPVEKPQTDDDDDAIGDDDVFMSPEEEKNGKNDDDAASTSEAKIDNFNMRSSWRSKLSQLFKYCQKQIVRNNPQVGSIYIRVKTRDEDAVKQAGFELENGRKEGESSQFKYTPTKEDRQTASKK
ncbi:hypothetical protein FOZ62_000225 [Perkinsus olseni]|uniref:Uncharacterized protein n=2 Tax=Perkinsus olseni TaxID=32597 RepID=A0A7J6Q245_PEROL|nr:hypothetical protein FOZ62_000225 [Perkinsus olseni]